MKGINGKNVTMIPKNIIIKKMEKMKQQSFAKNIGKIAQVKKKLKPQVKH